MTATLIPLLAAILASPPAHAQRASVFTVLHTNDWQSRLLGFGPNADYSPETVGDDDTIGGVARLSTLIDAERERAGGRGPVLLLDGGDVTMGTLFHTVTRETGGELRLMHQLGYDAITLGNHDFDFRPEGTARMIRAALEAGGCPPIVATNLRFDPDDPRDDDLEALAAEGVIEDYLVIERQGLRFGVFGLLGERAFEVMGQSAPLSIADPIQVARETVHTLREIRRWTTPGRSPGSIWWSAATPTPPSTSPSSSAAPRSCRPAARGATWGAW
jgi:5'-nucleotidase/UDP-sugar diphosphatase